MRLAHATVEGQAQLLSQQVERANEGRYQSELNARQQAEAASNLEAQVKHVQDQVELLQRVAKTHRNKGGT